MPKHLKIKVKANYHTAHELLRLFDHKLSSPAIMLSNLTLQKLQDKLFLMTLHAENQTWLKLSPKEALAFWLYATETKQVNLNPFVLEIYQLIDRQLNTVKP